MQSSTHFWQSQYELIRQSRAVLLSYCADMLTADFLQENSSFGRGSIRNLLVHIANTYQFWIGRHALGREMDFTAYTAVNDVEETIRLFQSIDELMADFFTRFADHPGQEIDFEIGCNKGSAIAMKLFTHVITHEFHHKGQVLSLSRHLGYVPVDTDVMR